MSQFDSFKTKPNSKSRRRKLRRLKLKINTARKQLQKLWNIKNFTDAEVLAAGAKLDILCNEYERLIHKNLGE